MVFWDDQHGHATYIKTPNNRHIVIDLGTGDYSSNNEAFSPLQHLKYNYHVNQLDYVIITHPHLEHISDILNFDDLRPKVLLCPRLTDQEIMESVRQEMKRNSKSIVK
jgi:competence protein ComEC